MFAATGNQSRKYGNIPVQKLVESMSLYNAFACFIFVNVIQELSFITVATIYV